MSMDNGSGSRNVRIMLDVGLPTEPPQMPQAMPLSVEDRVRDALDCIDSGYKSDVEWIMINKLYKSLAPRRGTSRRIDNLLQMIEPIMAKYGYHEVAANGN